MRPIRPSHAPKIVNRIGFLSWGYSDLEAEFLDVGVKDQCVGCDRDFDTQRRLNEEFIDGVDGSNIGDGSSDSHIFFEEWNRDGRQVEI